MSVIDLRGIIVVEPLSTSEGVCFSAIVTLDDRRVGIAMGDGHRRPALHVADTAARLAIERACEARHPGDPDPVARWIEDTVTAHREHQARVRQAFAARK